MENLPENITSGSYEPLQLGRSLTVKPPATANTVLVLLITLIIYCLLIFAIVISVLKKETIKIINLRHLRRNPRPDDESAKPDSQRSLLTSQIMMSSSSNTDSGFRVSRQNFGMLGLIKMSSFASGFG